MSKEKDLRELFHDTLKDIYFAENKIIKTLPKWLWQLNRRIYRSWNDCKFSGN